MTPDTDFSNPEQVQTLAAAAGLDLDLERAAALLPLVREVLAGQRRLAAVALPALTQGRTSPFAPLWPENERTP